MTNFSPVQLESINSAAKSLNMTSGQFVLFSVVEQLKRLKVDSPIHSSGSVFPELDCDFVGCAHHPEVLSSLASVHVCDFKTCRLNGVAS